LLPSIFDLFVILYAACCSQVLHALHRWSLVPVRVITVQHLSVAAAPNKTDVHELSVR